MTLPMINWADLDTGKKGRTLLNKQVFENNACIRACDNACIEPTIRQASKFRRKLGLAYKGK
ncbi:MAG: hypothetical protein GQ540_03865 [Lutibacter sp.]|uniref:hypothetical protein n=1 Tax=Lutibacter sp. TaxID=1925666 RepID=UPI0019F1C624|nr:hypothetical protein [Lutibacter sp.]NOR27650.1 hypothetical protein [Lutibacter sp.]